MKSPITVTYMGVHSMLRPWNPHSCVLAAAIHNGLIHFPIQPGTCVFTVDCGLQTLGHVADIVGAKGRVIGVISEHCSPRPTSDEFRMFFKRHPSAYVIFEDIQCASLDRYKRLLGLPASSKYAFLMALHPRLGAESAAHRLNEGPTKLIRHIFSFLEFADIVEVKCLVVCHGPQGTTVEMIRDVVLSHVDILKNWSAAAREADAESGIGASATEDRHGHGASSPSTDEEAARTGETGHHEGRQKKFKANRQSVPQWVLLDLPTDNIINNNAAVDDKGKLLTEVVENLKRLGGRVRTGLYAKEQLLLTPFFPDHALLLLKNYSHRDERHGKVAKKWFSPPPGLEDMCTGQEIVEGEADRDEETTRLSAETTKDAGKDMSQEDDREKKRMYEQQTGISSPTSQQGP